MKSSSQIEVKEEGTRKIRTSQKESLPPNAKFVLSLDINLMIVNLNAQDAKSQITPKKIVSF